MLGLFLQIWKCCVFSNIWECLGFFKDLRMLGFFKRLRVLGFFKNLQHTLWLRRLQTYMRLNEKQIFFLRFTNYLSFWSIFMIYLSKIPTLQKRSVNTDGWNINSSRRTTAKYQQTKKKVETALEKNSEKF